mgnify:CR=1 FL=1|tara:strand:- start:250 stop:603 length:354 start_codon:yes stop_codon:yes gene_type:complete
MSNYKGRACQKVWEIMIYCFDLDGTLCTQRYLDYENAEPYRDRIDIVNSLYEKGHTIIIDTARGSGATKGKDWFDITVNQLNGWGLKYHTLRVGIKFSADVYVDDKATHANAFFDEV